MKFPRSLLLALVLLSSSLPASAAGRTPVILVTDIGTDIDDTWALGMLLRSPELDLKLVLTDSADTRYRAAVAAKFLAAAGRSDVPVGIGWYQEGMGDDVKNLLPWVAGYDLKKYAGKVYPDGIAALIDVIRKSADPITVIAIGPVPSLARAVEQAPDIAAKCRFVGMFGSFDIGYSDSGPSAESNVKVDPAALRKVLTAPWRDILLTPLDTCGGVYLDGEHYHSIWCATRDPLLRAVIESYCIFAPRVNWMKCDYFTTQSTTLFDCVAVYLAYAEEFVQVETITFEITDDGYTRRSAQGPCKARVAIRWKNHDAFEAHLAARLLGH
jgi:inosine-uridine nucleoside N-ribohydrolase